MDKSSSPAPAGHSPAAAPVAGAPVAPAAPPEQPVIRVSGILDIDLQRGGNGQLLDIAKGGKRRPSDPFVPKELIRRFKLRAGSLIGGTAFPPDGRFPNPKMKFIETVDGQDIDARRHLLDFNSLTTVSPNQHLRMELKDGRMTTRAVDLFCPIGKGTRGLIVAPPRTGKTMLLQSIANSITKNHPEVYLIVLLIDERPEEVTDMQRSVRGEVISSTFDEPAQRHVQVAPDLQDVRQDHVPSLAIDTGQRFVQQQDRRSRHQRARNRDTLLLASAQLRHAPVEQRLEIEDPGQRSEVRVCRAVGDVGTDTQVREQQRILWHIADAPVLRTKIDPLLRGVQDAIADADLAAIGRADPRNRF